MELTINLTPNTAAMQLKYDYDPLVANQEFDEQKVERHEVRQVLRGVRQLTPEAWAEARRQRAEGRNGQAATEASCSTLPPLS